MRRVLHGLAYAAAGYVVSGVIGYVLVMALSGNTHDREIEAAVLGAVRGGPRGLAP